MDVGDMQQRDIAERVELEKFGFAQVLLRDRAHEALPPAASAAVAAPT